MNEPQRASPPLLPPLTVRNWERCDVAGPLAPLRGRRLILVNESGSNHDWRAWSEVEPAGGHLIIWAVPEEAWWRHRNLAMKPSPIRWPAAAAWVEDE